MSIFPDSCTLCGRRFRDNETFEITRVSTETGVEYEFFCALHTDHDTAGNWHTKVENANE